MKLCHRTALPLLLPTILFLASSTRAQGPGGNQPDIAIDAATRSAVVDGLIKLLNENYVFPETAAKMEKALRDHQNKKDYDNIGSGAFFAETLTAHLQE